MEEKKCLECGTPILGRADKKFCSDYCRNVYNNRLKKNWNILEELNTKETTKIHGNKLTVKNFDFNYFTSLYKTKKNEVYYFVYDQGYKKLGDNYYLLVKKKID